MYPNSPILRFDLDAELIFAKSCETATDYQFGRPAFAMCLY
jgi:hypothetical protein